jgi:hypothetical protein
MVVESPWNQSRAALFTFPFVHYKCLLMQLHGKRNCGPLSLFSNRKEMPFMAVYVEDILQLR